MPFRPRRCSLIEGLGDPLVSSVLPIAGEFLGDAAQVVAIVVRQISGASTARLAVGWTALK